MPDHHIRILFICMGNICRSPMAECLFRHHASAQGVMHRFVVDSAGTGGWHRGQEPDERMRDVAAKHGVVVAGAARQIVPDDLHEFDHVLCMDQSNLDEVLSLEQGTASVRLMLEHHPDDVRDVPDPYYGGVDGFQDVFGLLDVAVQQLLRDVVEQHGLQA